MRLAGIPLLDPVFESVFTRTGPVAITDAAEADRSTDAEAGSMRADVPGC